MKVLILAAASLLICLECQAATTLFVSLHPAATVSRAELRLSDIASVQSADARVRQEISTLPAPRCASLARPCAIHRSDVIGVVEARASELGASLVWGAGETVKVSGLLRTVSLEAAIDRAGVGILQRVDGGRPAAVRVEQGPTTVEVPPGTVHIQPALGEMRRIGAVVELPIEVRVDGELAAKPMIRYAVLRSAAAAPASDRAAHPTSSARSADAADTSGSDGAVVKDQTVRIVIASGALQIESEGMALSDARIGETVEVRRGSARFRGKAVDTGTVLVEEN